MLITSFEMDARRTGIKEGIKEGIMKTVENMRRKNCDNEFISEITGLSIDEIENLDNKATLD